ncbi:hypothetical protein TFLX_00253 [Thermoflexales bacterium]|nr:hypothetical protein TFLX_00253 [Thermoflexales bacterium]
MKSARELIGMDLKWGQPNARKYEFELHADGQLAATLRFRSEFGTFATAESADGCWTFKRTGFWHPQVSVRVCGAEENLAFFKPHTWRDGGTLELSGERQLLASTNFWQTDYQIKTAGDVPLIRFKPSGVLHLSADFEIAPEAAAWPELTWLVPFSWYLWLLSCLDGAAAAGLTAMGAAIAI